MTFSTITTEYACVLPLVLIYLCRREALRRWKSKQGLRATYGNLLELCVNAGHSMCAEAVCQVLRNRCSIVQVRRLHDGCRVSGQEHMECPRMYMSLCFQHVVIMVGGVGVPPYLAWMELRCC